MTPNPANKLPLGLVVVVALLAVLMAPDPRHLAASSRAVSTTRLSCPEQLLSARSASTHSSLVIQANNQEGGGLGTASVREIDSASDIARVERVNDPVSLLAAGDSVAPILLSATGDWAAQAAAGFASFETVGAAAGLASVACTTPDAQWWFVGASNPIGGESALLVANPTEQPARFDVLLFSRTGPIRALAGSGIDLKPQANLRLRLDALTNTQDLLAVQVRASSGRVTVALRDVAAPEISDARGVDFIPRAQSPATTLVLAGIAPGPGARDLVLVNPGAQFATVSAQVITESGSDAIADPAEITVPAGSVISVPVAESLTGRAASLLLESDIPIAGGLKAQFGAQERDTAWLAAVPAVIAPNSMAAAVAVPAGSSIRTTVTVAAPTNPVAGTLTVSLRGSSQNSRFTEAGIADQDGRSQLSQLQLSTDEQTQRTIHLKVAAGSERRIEIPDVASSMSLWWTSDPESGAVFISHLTRGLVGATGYSWWPVASSVQAIPVREDLGVLVPSESDRGDTKSP